ncbi:MAG: YbbR-like domain-containing protein [Anaerolineales bacterium]
MARIEEHIGTALLALILALIVWVNATYQKDPPREDFFPREIPIQVLNAPTDLVVTNDPADALEVKIRTFSSTWEQLGVNDFNATADWGDLEANMNTVDVEVTCADPTVKILDFHPKTIYVRLEPKREEDKEVEVVLEGRGEVPLGYRVYSPEVEPDSVTVAGPSSAVDRVEKVSISVSLVNQRQSLERQVEPVPLDSEGERVTDVTISPAEVTLRVPIERRQNYREVAIRVRTTGAPSRGYFFSGLDVVPPTVTVVGPLETIEEMGGYVETKGQIDLTGATRMIAQKMEIDLPEGVSVLDSREGEPFFILVTANIDAVTGGTTVEVPLRGENVQEDLRVEMSVSAVDVILTGPAALLEELETDLLDAYVDLDGLEEGTHQVEPKVEIIAPEDSELQDLAVKDVSPKYVEVTLNPGSTPVSGDEVSPTPTATNTVTPTMTPTQAPTATPTIERRR